MTIAPSHPDLPALLSKVADGDLTAREFDRLEAILLDDPTARAAYHQQMRVHALLHWRWNPVRKECSSLTSDVPAASFPQLPTGHYPLPTSFVGGPVFSYMVAMVVLCLMLLGAWAYKISHVPDLDVAGNSRRSTTSGPSDRVYVGRITSMKDCHWSDPDTQTVVGAAVSLDRQYALASGLLEITYRSGAKVILEGPCTYKVDSDAGGYLAAGKLTARIDGAKPQATNPEPHNSSLVPHPSSLFSVHTPTAIITDLGTEFGVEVDKDKNTMSYVFEGSVRVRTNSEAGDNVREVVLGEHQAATVEKSNDGADLRITKDASDNETPAEGKKNAKKQSLGDRFVRVFPSLDSRKPLASRSNPVPGGGIRIDGQFDDWRSVKPYPDDAPDDATFDPNTSVDLIRAAIAHDEDRFYFFYEQANPVGILRYVPWVFLDTDKNPRTGRHFSRLEYPLRMVPTGDPWSGRDYRVEGGNRDRFPLPLGAEFNLSGRSNIFVWSPQGYAKTRIIDFGTEGIEYAVAEDMRKVEICVPRRLLGDPRDFHVIWIAQNRAESAEGEQGITDFYPDEASDRDIRGFFRYSTDSAP